jgi:hypothetical protein
MIRKTLIGMLLAAAAATLVLGVGSYWKGVPSSAIWINTEAEKPRVQVGMIDGKLHVVYSAPRRIGMGDHDLRFGGFYAKRIIVGGSEAMGIGAPFWFIGAVLLTAPSIALVRGPLRRNRRRRRGECVQCGYKLTGLVEPRCPECGREFTRHDDASTLEPAPASVQAHRPNRPPTDHRCRC